MKESKKNFTVVYNQKMKYAIYAKLTHNNHFECEFTDDEISKFLRYLGRVQYAFVNVDEYNSEEFYTAGPYTIYIDIVSRIKNYLFNKEDEQKELSENELKTWIELISVLESRMTIIAKASKYLN